MIEGIIFAHASVKSLPCGLLATIAARNDRAHVRYRNARFFALGPRHPEIERARNKVRALLSKKANLNIVLSTDPAEWIFDVVTGERFSILPVWASRFAPGLMRRMGAKLAGSGSIPITDAAGSYRCLRRFLKRTGSSIVTRSSIGTGRIRNHLSTPLLGSSSGSSSGTRCNADWSTFHPTSRRKRLSHGATPRDSSRTPTLRLGPTF